MPQTRSTTARTVGLAGFAVLAACAVLTSVQATDRSVRPVSDAMLQQPDPGDWLSWRRTLDGTGFSPLREITRENVANLQQIWSRDLLTPGTNYPAPLVHDGVMYLPNPGGIQALDAATGALIWEHRRPVSRRNIAIYGDRIFLTTGNAHVVALDARSGSVAWDTLVDDPAGKRFGFSSGPIVAAGRVVSGMTGCGRYQEDTCYIVAHDATTGRELWRTSTIARPGEPGDSTWGETPLMFRAGGEPWMPGSYDAASGLIYWGTAQAKPWAAVQRGTADLGLLYTNSTLALDPDSGTIRWHFQHIPGESHDMDEAFESILVDRGTRRSIFRMGKVGVLWELDRETGAFLAAHDLGYQTLLDVDPTTGRATYRPGKVPRIGTPVEYCPGPGGFKTMWSMAYHPDTDAFVIPLNMTCVRSVFEEQPRAAGGGGNGPVTRKTLPHPASPDHIGRLAAIDSRTGSVRWMHDERFPYNTAVLTTGGGLAFVADWTGSVYAHDAETGRLLWQGRLAGPGQGWPITYTAGGRQYVAVPSGPGSTFGAIGMADLHPEVSPSRTGMAVHVFALPTGGAPKR